MNTAINRDIADLILYADPPLTGQQRPGEGGGGSHIHVLYGEVPRFSLPPPFLKPISSTIGYGFLTLWATALLGGISS